MKRIILSAFALAALAGCSQITPDVQFICPSPPVYTPQEQQAVANEIKQYGSAIPNTVDQIISWNRMQDELNRCNGVVPNAPAPVKKKSFF